MKRLRQSWLPRLAGLLGAALGLALVHFAPGLTTVARDRVFDQFQRLAPRAPAADPVRVVEIDEAALDAVGQWPWPRHRLAEFADRLNDAGAAAIVFDILLAEPDRTSPANAARNWTDDPALNAIRAELGAAEIAEADHDRLLAAALARAPTVLNISAGPDAAQDCPAPLRSSAVQGVTAADIAAFARSFRQPVSSLPELRAAASGEGFARAALAGDAIVRAVPLIALACDGRELYPSLAVEALRVAAPRLDPRFAPEPYIAAGKRPCRTHVRIVEGAAVSQVMVCRLAMPTNEDGEMWVRYSSRETARRRALSAADLFTMSGDELANAVGGRIVIIGAAAEGLRDTLITPLGDERPGAQVHADVIEQALSGVMLQRVDDVMRPIEIGGALALAAVMIILMPRLGAGAGFAMFAALSAAIFAGAFYTFAVRGVLADPVTPWLILGPAFVGAFVVLFEQEQHARRFIRAAFGKFLAPEVVERIEKDPSLLRLEGETREITAFFSDIRGFTGIANKLSATQTAAFLNQYFTAMTRIVTEHDGLVDKYMGDGLAAMWNAPLDVERHTEKAARAALAMLRELETLNARWRAERSLPVDAIRIGVGLHVDEAQVGNFGSEDHLEYSMLGDMVNLTARIETLSKIYRAPIILTAAVRERIPEFAIVPLGAATVAGRADAVVLFALAGDEKVAALAAFAAFRRRMETGVAALEAGDVETARHAFADCLKADCFGLDDTVAYFSALASTSS